VNSALVHSRGVKPDTESLKVKLSFTFCSADVEQCRIGHYKFFQILNALGSVHLFTQL